MNNQESEFKKIDFLELSDSEKTKLIRATKEALRQRIEEAKFWRTLIETDGIILNGNSVIF